MNIGYACINMQLSYPQKYGGAEKGVKPITTGRSMIKQTDTLNLFEIYDYINKLEKRIKRLEAKLRYRKNK